MQRSVAYPSSSSRAAPTVTPGGNFPTVSVVDLAAEFGLGPAVHETPACVATAVRDHWRRHAPGEKANGIDRANAVSFTGTVAVTPVGADCTVERGNVVNRGADGGRGCGTHRRTRSRVH